MVPHGKLVFFPSHEQLNDAVSHWRSTGLLERHQLLGLERFCGIPAAAAAFVGSRAEQMGRSWEKWGIYGICTMKIWKRVENMGTNYGNWDILGISRDYDSLYRDKVEYINGY